MRKSMVVILVMACLVFMASSYGFAQTTNGVTGIADTTKEGSLLIWPLIDTHDPYDTYIMIANSGPVAGKYSIKDKEVNIKCYWEVKGDPGDPLSTCYLSDFVISLSTYASVIFKASNGEGLDGRGIASGIGYDQTGTLKCFAIDGNDTAQISWNHLSGYAIIKDGEDVSTTALQYPAWRFAANLVFTKTGLFVDSYSVGKIATDPDNATSNYGELRLAGCNQLRANDLCPAGMKPFTIKAGKTMCVMAVNQQCNKPACLSNANSRKAVYDACAQYLIFDFLAEPSSPTADDGWALNYLSLTPCKEDLRNGATYDFLTRLQFSIWNENEVKFTGTYDCSNCDYGRSLSSIATSGGISFFKAANLHTAAGRFRVQALANQYGPCSTVKISDDLTLKSEATPLVGVMTTTLIYPGDLASVDQVATNPTLGPPAFATATQEDKSGYYPAWIRWTPPNYYPY
jgi:hypothetical protein